MTSTEEYKEYMRTISEHDGSVFMQVRFDHVRFLKGDGSAAIVLSHILNLLRMKNSNEKDRQWLKEHDLWLPCPANKTQKKLGMSEERLKTALSNLENKKLIEISHRAGNLIWVRVNVDTLKTIKDEEESETANSGIREQRNQKPLTAESETANSGIPCENKQTNKQSMVSASPASPPKAPYPPKPFNFGQDIETRKRNLPKPSKQCIDWANKYIRILKNKPKPEIVSASYMTWAREFEWLWENINQDTGRINDFLDKYEETVKLIEKPILNTVKSFRDNFGWLERTVNEQTGTTGRKLETKETVNENGKKITRVSIPEYDE